MSDIAAMTDAAMDGRPSCGPSRSTPLPPPLSEAGAIGWLRQNLFSGAAQHRCSPSLCALLIVWIVPPLVKFLLIDAVWDGAEPRRLPADGRTSARSAPAGPSSSTGISFFIYGFYPIDERWRVDVFFVLLAFGIVWLAWLDAPRRDLGAIYFFVVMPIALAHPAARLAAVGLPRGRDRALGRPAGDPRGRGGRHRRLAAARHPAGARPPLARCRRCGCSRVIFIESCAACR